MRPSSLQLLLLSLLAISSGPSAAVTLDRRQTLPTGATASRTTTGPVPSSTSSTNASAPGKAGLAWANQNSVDIGQFEVTGKVTWYYTWSPYPLRNSGWGTARNGNTKLEFAPMLWGNKSIENDMKTIEEVLRSNGTSGGAKVNAVLGFNEPEQPSQSNFTPSVGVQLWRDYLLPLRSKYPGLRLGSPAVSSGPQGKAWLESFFEECAGRCDVDFVAMHWYGTNADAFIAHLWDYHHAFGNLTTSGTLWVTEWACHNFVSNQQCSQRDVVSFMNQTQSFMDSTDWVERYAWFGAMTNLQGVNPDNALLDSEGDLNSLGRQYVDASPDQPLRNSAIGLNAFWIGLQGISLPVVFSWLLYFLF